MSSRPLQHQVRLEQQAAHAHIPTCAICFSALVDKDQDLLQEMDVVVWRDCGHVYHESCMQDMFGILPRTRRIPINEDDDDDDDENYDESGFKRCPECPICRRKGGNCSQRRCGLSALCNPTQRIYLSGSDISDHTPFPLTIYVDDKVEDVLDLAAVARAIGVDVERLVDLAGEDERWEWVAEGNELKARGADVKRVHEQLKGLMMKLQREKATNVLPTHMANLHDQLEKYSDIANQADNIATLNQRLELAHNSLRQAEIIFASTLSQISSGYDTELKRLAEVSKTRENGFRTMMDSKTEALDSSRVDVAYWKKEFSKLEAEKNKLEGLNAGLMGKVAEFEEEQKRIKQEVEKEVEEAIEERMRAEREKILDLRRDLVQAFDTATGEAQGPVTKKRKTIATVDSLDDLSHSRGTRSRDPATANANRGFAVLPSPFRADRELRRGLPAVRLVDPHAFSTANRIRLQSSRRRTLGEPATTPSPAAAATKSSMPDEFPDPMVQMRLQRLQRLQHLPQSSPEPLPPTTAPVQGHVEKERAIAEANELFANTPISLMDLDDDELEDDSNDNGGGDDFYINFYA